MKARIDLEEEVDGRTYGEMLTEARSRGLYAYHRPTQKIIFPQEKDLSRENENNMCCFPIKTNIL